MRDKIYQVAKDLFMRHGLGQLTLGMVAERAGISRPAIHYHVKTKARLAEEVLEDYARSTLGHSRTIWIDPNASLRQKFERSLAFFRERYLHYNPGGRGDLPWSLFSRFYQESELMTPVMVSTLRSAARELETFYQVAVEMAIMRGELRAGTPAADLALQLVAMVHQVGWLTWCHARFEPVEQLYASTLKLWEAAYGPAPVADAQATGTARARRKSP